MKPTQKQLDYIEIICERLDGLEKPKIETKEQATKWLERYVPIYKQEIIDDSAEWYYNGEYL